MNKYFTESEVMTQDFLDWLESRHLKLRTTNEVRAAWFGWKAAHDRLLEAQERAVPVMIVNHVSSAEHDLPIGMKLYTHPSPSDAERLAEALRNGLTDALRNQRQVDNDGTECGVSRQAVDEAIELLEALAAHSDQSHQDDNELPGMWSHSDFVGGDPDERSYAERQAQPPAASVTVDAVMRVIDGQRRLPYCSIDEKQAFRNELEAALAAQEKPNERQ